MLFFTLPWPNRDSSTWQHASAEYASRDHEGLGRETRNCCPGKADVQDADNGCKEGNYALLRVCYIGLARLSVYFIYFLFHFIYLFIHIFSFLSWSQVVCGINLQVCFLWTCVLVSIIVVIILSWFSSNFNTEPQYFLHKKYWYDSVQSVHTAAHGVSYFVVTLSISTALSRNYMPRCTYIHRLFTRGKNYYVKD